MYSITSTCFVTDIIKIDRLSYDISVIIPIGNVETAEVVVNVFAWRQLQKPIIGDNYYLIASAAYEPNTFKASAFSGSKICMDDYDSGILDAVAATFNLTGKVSGVQGDTVVVQYNVWHDVDRREIERRCTISMSGKYWEKRKKNKVKAGLIVNVIGTLGDGGVLKSELFSTAGEAVASYFGKRLSPKRLRTEEEASMGMVQVEDNMFATATSSQAGPSAVGEDLEEPVTPPRRKCGRPKGSKNRPKGTGKGKGKAVAETDDEDSDM